MLGSGCQHLLLGDTVQPMAECQLYCLVFEGITVIYVLKYLIFRDVH